MKYISTRGKAPVLNFEEAMLTGLARDGGLYVPQSIPSFSRFVFTDFPPSPYFFSGKNSVFLKIWVGGFF